MELDAGEGRESRLGRRDDSERSRIGFLTGLRRRNALYRRDRTSSTSRAMGARPQVHFTNPIADTMEPAPIDMNEPYPYTTTTTTSNTNATGPSRMPMWMASSGTSSSTSPEARIRSLYERDDAALSFSDLLNSMRTRQRHRHLDDPDDHDGSSTTTDDESCIT